MILRNELIISFRKMANKFIAYIICKKILFLLLIILTINQNIKAMNTVINGEIIPVDATELYTFAGGVWKVSVDGNESPMVPRPPVNDDLLKKYKLTLKDEALDTKKEVVKIIECTMPTEINDDDNDNDDKKTAYEFIKKIKFSIVSPDQTIKEISDIYKNAFLRIVSAIRQAIFAIAKNPIGLRLLKRINTKAQSINFIVDKDMDFMTIRNDVYMPAINIDPKLLKAKRKDANVVSLCKNSSGKFCLREIPRPYYVGIVHELIHVLHYLEETYIKPSYGIPVSLGESGLWGCNPEDCFVITGIRKKLYDPFDDQIIYEPISEFSFRIHDNLPVRISYPAVELPEKTYEDAVSEICTNVDEGTITSIIRYIMQKSNMSVSLFCRTEI